MCGIAGIFSNTTSPDPEQLDRMVDLLEHRGPDSRGVFLEGPLGFGMRRLSIIDLSTGEQPIFNEDESICIVFNGEIYNYPQLRTELEAKGHRFKTASDTESILHLYEEYGEECVKHLQGMFAFAIWERKRGKLFIARDPTLLLRDQKHYRTSCRTEAARPTSVGTFLYLPLLSA